MANDYRGSAAPTKPREYWTVFDHLGGLAALADTSGTFAEVYRYDGFGGPWYSRLRATCK